MAGLLTALKNLFSGPSQGVQGSSLQPGLEDFLLLRRRVEDWESRLGDLTERFNRFQNREGMRKARDGKTVEEQALALLESAQDGLGAISRGGGATQSTPSKDDLRKALITRRRH